MTAKEIDNLVQQKAKELYEVLPASEKKVNNWFRCLDSANGIIRTFVVQESINNWLSVFAICLDNER